ncbi:hypothetical protein FHS27_001164 [Rhodopirellula rubra]|uniref:Uncharacterized protein n=1 Tax=Aporhodopirellula rubra TaxID=980271 RepID=A0A7W5DVL8_9BACT|nr:hypothetical protein [Aporhodopirellula rubra]
MPRTIRLKHACYHTDRPLPSQIAIAASNLDTTPTVAADQSFGGLSTRTLDLPSMPFDAEAL